MDRVFFRDGEWLDRPLSGFGKVLDVGAGGVRRAPHVTTMDILPLPNTDVVHDADVHPWPFEEDVFDYVILSNVFEHIADLIPFMRELHRIVRPGGIVRGITPHFSNPCSYADVTHKRALSLHALDYFCAPRRQTALCRTGKEVLGCGMELGDQFVLSLFEMRRLSLRFREILWLTLAPIWANLFQDFFEVYASRLLPAWDIYFELAALPAERQDASA